MCSIQKLNLFCSVFSVEDSNILAEQTVISSVTMTTHVKAEPKESNNTSDADMTSNEICNENIKTEDAVDSTFMSSALKEDSSDSATSDQLNFSGGESTGMLLTKALNTLVRSDYDVITPPRTSHKATHGSEQRKKKPTLFRPYELDNGISNDRTSLIPMQSPMLLRSNYHSTGSEWLIERRNKSEAVYNSDIIRNCEHVANTFDKPVNFVEPIRTRALCNIDNSDMEVIQAINSILEPNSPTSDSRQGDIGAETSNQAPIVVIPASVIQPLRSSTPKSSPCPSPNVPPSEIEALRSLPKHLSSPVLTGSPSDNLNELYRGHRQAYCDRRSKQLITDQTDADKCHREQRCTSSQMVKYRSHNPTHVRSLADEGHRLPLKHSYKHLPLPLQASERPRSPFGETASQRPDRSRTPVRQEIPPTDRFRSNSCPPYSPKAQGVPKAVDLSDSAPLKSKPQIITNRAQKEIFSNNTKSYLEAVKETWAMHHAVMTSSTPGTKSEKPVLPSFSTFTAKTPAQRLKVSHSSSNIRHNHPNNEKHSRSRSEGGIQKSSTPFIQKLNCDVKKATPEPQTGNTKVPISMVQPVLWKLPVADVNRPSSSQTHTDVSGKVLQRSADVQTTSQVGQYGRVATSHGTVIVSRTRPDSVPTKPYRFVPTQSDAPFNPSMDIYKDPVAFRSPYLGCPVKPVLQPQMYDPRYVSRFGGMPPPFLNPLTAKMYNPELLQSSMHAPATSVRQGSSFSSPSTTPIPVSTGSCGRNFYQTESSQGAPRYQESVDVRRPLGTSSLQNQSPVQSPVTLDPKLNPLMCMIKVIQITYSTVL